MFLLSAVDVVLKMVTVCEMANTVSRIGTVCVCICRQAIAISVRVYVCVHVYLAAGFGPWPNLNL